MLSLVIFARVPHPGKVKTRLAATVGEAGACEIYRQLLHRTAELARSLGGIDVTVAAPEAPEQLCEFFGPNISGKIQAHGDLGVKMSAAFDEQFRDGASRVVMICSDCPWITRGDIEAAFQGLGEHDLVLGPATDGGYWLIGLKRPAPGLFTGVAWSTNTVFDETLKKAAALNLRVAQLRTLSDIDTENDWNDYQKKLRQSSDRQDPVVVKEPSANVQ